MKYKVVLLNKGFQYDPHKHQWFDGKKPVDSSEPHIFLIRAFKACNIPDAGLKAELALSDAETSPELTFTHFKKQFLKREYGARVKGLDVFLQWAKFVGIEVDVENIVLWCKKHPFIIHRFYNAAEQAGIHIKNRARIFGLVGIFNHVFVGFKLVIRKTADTFTSWISHSDVDNLDVKKQNNLVAITKLKHTG